MKTPPRPLSSPGCIRPEGRMRIETVACLNCATLLACCIRPEGRMRIETAITTPHVCRLPVRSCIRPEGRMRIETGRSTVPSGALAPGCIRPEGRMRIETHTHDSRRSGCIRPSGRMRIETPVRATPTRCIRPEGRMRIETTGWGQGPVDER